VRLERERHQEETAAAHAQMTFAEGAAKERAQAEKKSATYKDYACYLTSQRELTMAKRMQIKADAAKPGIAPELHGYPSIPETPAEQRRTNKLNQQKYLKAELERQLEQQRMQKEKALSQQKLQDYDNIQKWNREVEDTRQRDLLRKVVQRETLLKAWHKEETIKEIKMSIGSPSLTMTVAPSSRLLEEITPPLVTRDEITDTRAKVVAPVSPRIDGKERHQQGTLKALRLKQKTEETDQTRRVSQSPDRGLSSIAGLTSLGKEIQVPSTQKYRKHTDPRALRGDREVQHYNKQPQGRVDRRVGSISSLAQGVSPKAMNARKLREYGRQSLQPS
jgi:hypothetical protein